MNSLHFAIAVLPLAMYLMLIGWLRTREHPFVTTGWRDMAALGIALMGLFAIGPMQLFFPVYAAARWPGFVWIALLVLYCLCLLLAILSCRPRLIVYGIDQREFTDALQRAAAEVDPASHWSGQVLNLPAVGLQFAQQATGSRNVHQIVNVGSLNSVSVWIAFEQAVVSQCRQLHAIKTRWLAATLILTGSVLMIAALTGILISPSTAFADLKEFILR